MKLLLRIGAEWQLTKLDGKTREPVLVTPWFKNLVTNIGLDRIGQGGAIGPNVRIGTGTTAPAASDTQLVAQVASTSTVVGTDSLVNAGSPNYESTLARTVEFGLGAVVGNMGEIGLGWASSGATLWSRARILDGGGSPTTIAVLSSEILQATYRIRVYPTLTDASGTVDISGTSYSYVSRVANVGTVRGLSWGPLIQSATATAHNGALGATTGAPAGSSTSLTATLSAYTDGTYQRNVVVSGSIGQGNLSGGISAILTAIANSVGQVWLTQTSFSPAIPKNGTNQLSLPFTFAWARH